MSANIPYLEKAHALDEVYKKRCGPKGPHRFFAPPKPTA
jgi:hypothetical protein